MTSEQVQGDSQVPVDGYLQFLVQQVNERGLSLRVTLSVGGAVVSGILIGERQYFEGLTRALEVVIARSGLRERIEMTAERREEEGASQEGRPSPEELATQTTRALLDRIVGGYKSGETEARRYVHLRDVRITSPGLQQSEHGGLWRGRLENVDGFMLGSPGHRGTGADTAAGSAAGQ